MMVVSENIYFTIIFVGIILSSYVIDMEEFLKKLNLF